MTCSRAEDLPVLDQQGPSGVQQPSLVTPASRVVLVYSVRSFGAWRYLHLDNLESKNLQQGQASDAQSARQEANPPSCRQS